MRGNISNTLGKQSRGSAFLSLALENSSLVNGAIGLYLCFARYNRHYLVFDSQLEASTTPLVTTVSLHYGLGDGQSSFAPAIDWSNRDARILRQSRPLTSPNCWTIGRRSGFTVSDQRYPD